MANESDWKIVLIDDEQGIRTVTGIALRDAGYEVFTAADGREGLEVCDRVRPQIVITDVRMPGMDGISVLENLKKSLPDTEVIVVTAFGEMELAIRALQLDASDFITKPIHDEALHLALERARDRYARRKQIQEYTLLLEEGWNETTAELMETYRFQNDLIESSMDGIVGCDADDRVVIFNRSMERILGYAKSEVLHRFGLGGLFHPENEKAFLRVLKKDRYGGENRLFMYQTAMKGKTLLSIPVQISASVITDQQGRQNGIVCFVRDLREIRSLEREIEDQAKILHQDKMMSLGRLAASVVHEINNPLAGVLNYCRLMIRILNRGDLKPEKAGKFEQYLSLVESETARCSEIVSNLLTFSRKTPVSFSNVEVRELLDRSVLLCQHKLELSNIRLVTDFHSDLPAIRGDFNQLQQCIINLIFNALDAMPAGGVLTIGASHKSSQNRVVITVQDSGIGIPEENISHIFEPFFTSKDEGYGVGLGLSTLYGIIQHHEGDVHVESRPGEGTRFSLSLPTANT